ncbi:MAG: hypothetical protein OXG35_14125, partial [Acidobacteria bacterium]|nr:hypothetical protein [Acidobacteriota bacterium]
AASILRGWRIVCMVREGRRRAAGWRLNLGGLDWPTIRARAAAMHAPSGVVTAPLRESVVSSRHHYVGHEVQDLALMAEFRDVPAGGGAVLETAPPRAFMDDDGDGPEYGGRPSADFNDGGVIHE